MEPNQETRNYVKVVLKKSSSTQKTGYDVDVRCDGTVTQEDMNRMANMAKNTALALQDKLNR